MRLHSPHVQRDGKDGSRLHLHIRLYCQSAITSFVPFSPHSYFSPVLCVCVSILPHPPSSFSLADCRCVNTCWKEVWQWARRWMQSRLVNNALWHSSVGECSVFCSALTPPPTPQKNVLFLPHPLDLDHVLSLAFVLSAWYLSIIIFMHWPPPPPCLQPFWLLRSALPERTAQACQRRFIPQLLAHANQFSCLCFDPLFAFPPSPLPLPAV